MQHPPEDAELVPEPRDPRYWTALAWLKEHMAELSKQYENKWVVIVDTNVVHSAGTQAEAREYVRQQDLSLVAIVWHLKGYVTL